MRPMDQKEEKIVDAAIAVFSRYGVRRTTMNDIASEAGLVRQTLYNVFDSKDDVLRATVRLLADRAVAAIHSGCAGVSSLSDKLDIVFKTLVVEPYDLINATPHADEIVSGLYAAAQDEMMVAAERYRSVIETILAPYAGRIARLGARFGFAGRFRSDHSGRPQAQGQGPQAPIRTAGDVQDRSSCRGRSGRCLTAQADSPGLLWNISIGISRRPDGFCPPASPATRRPPSRIV